MSTIRGTTPTFTINLNGVDLTQNYRVYITIDQNGTQLTKDSFSDAMQMNITKIEADEGSFSTQIDLHLTQEETLMFDVGNAEIQAKWIDVTGAVEASDISNVKFSRALLEDVVQS